MNFMPSANVSERIQNVMFMQRYHDFLFCNYPKNKLALRLQYINTTSKNALFPWFCCQKSNLNHHIQIVPLENYRDNKQKVSLHKKSLKCSIRYLRVMLPEHTALVISQAALGGLQQGKVDHNKNCILLCLTLEVSYTLKSLTA